MGKLCIEQIKKLWLQHVFCIFICPFTSGNAFLINIWVAKFCTDVRIIRFMGFRKPFSSTEQLGNKNLGLASIFNIFWCYLCFPFYKRILNEKNFHMQDWIFTNAIQGKRIILIFCVVKGWGIVKRATSGVGLLVVLESSSFWGMFKGLGW